MNKFEKQLEKWNNGTLRGAQAKLAKYLHVSTATVALWTTGRRHPSKGYVSKMAQLFKLDIYHVARLFTPSVTYQDVVPKHPSLSLHDTGNVVYPYLPTQIISTADMVTLPLFTQSIAEHANTSQPHECCILPRTVAKGASFLFKLPHTQDPERILLIRSITKWQNHTIMLAQRQSSYLLVRVTIQRSTVFLKSMQGDSLPVSSYKPLGVVVRQITTVN